MLSPVTFPRRQPETDRQNCLCSQLDRKWAQKTRISEYCPSLLSSCVWPGYFTGTVRQFWELLRANQMMNEEQKSDAIDLARLTGNIAAQTGLGWAVPGVSVTATGTHFARLTFLPSFLPLSHYSTLVYTSLQSSTCRKYCLDRSNDLFQLKSMLKYRNIFSKFVKYFLLEWFPVPRIKYFLTRGGIVCLSYFMRPPPRISGFIVIPFLFLTIY